MTTAKLQRLRKADLITTVEQLQEQLQDITETCKPKMIIAALAGLIIGLSF